MSERDRTRPPGNDRATVRTHDDMLDLAVTGSPLTKPLHSLSPQELADQGIPVEVALRARIEGLIAEADGAQRDDDEITVSECMARANGVVDALVVVEGAAEQLRACIRDVVRSREQTCWHGNDRYFEVVGLEAGLRTALAIIEAQR